MSPPEPLEPLPAWPEPPEPPERLEPLEPLEVPELAEPLVVPLLRTAGALEPFPQAEIAASDAPKVAIVRATKVRTRFIGNAFPLGSPRTASAVDHP